MVLQRCLSAARDAAQAVRRSVIALATGVCGLVLVVLLLALVAAPGAAVLYVCVTWVLAVPGGRPFYPTAFGGLFMGSYLLIVSLCAGSLSRRGSARVARLRPTRVAAARPGARVAIAGRVVQGRPVDPERVPDWLLAQHGGTVEGLVGYPIVIEDEDGEPIRVEGHDGPEAPEEPRADGWPGILMRPGAPVFALGELRRVEGAGGYRGGVASWRLVKGAAGQGGEPDFRVREGTQADLVRVMQSGETSRWWGTVAIAMLVMGGLSVWLAQG